MDNNSKHTSKSIKSSLMLLLTSFIWGFAFVSQRMGLATMGMHTFNATRFLLAAFVLLLFILFTDIKDKKKAIVTGYTKNNKKQRRNLITAGTICGVILAIANTLQMAGLQFTTIGKAGFITILYIIIVPLTGIFFKKHINLSVWVSVMLALGGSYLLFIQEGFSINKGDLLILGCAFLFAAHIMVIDHYTKITDSVRMAFIQFFVCGVISMIAMFIFEQPDIKVILSAWLPIAYAGVLSSGVAYTFQFIAQKNLSAPVASLIMSMESVFAVLAGWIIFQESLSVKEILGCVLIFFGILIVQIPFKNKKISKQI